MRSIHVLCVIYILHFDWWGTILMMVSIWFPYQVKETAVNVDDAVRELPDANSVSSKCSTWLFKTIHEAHKLLNCTCRNQRICGEIIQKLFSQSLIGRTAHLGKQYKRLIQLLLSTDDDFSLRFVCPFHHWEVCEWQILDSGEPIGLKHFKPIKPLGSGDTGRYILLRRWLSHLEWIK